MANYRRIALVTDFGIGPYIGQIRLLLAEALPTYPVIDLINDLKVFRPELAAYLIPALVRNMPDETIYLTVVDPGVGSDRLALAVEADGNLYIGPDNGLLALVVRRARNVRTYRVDWRPSVISNSFHGRDLFTPVAIAMAFDGTLERIPIDLSSLQGIDWPDDRLQIIYQDWYGNLITGVRAMMMRSDDFIYAGDQKIRYARTFCEVPIGTPFWYENAFGLVEIAVNQGCAAQALALRVGDDIMISQAINH